MIKMTLSPLPTLGTGFWDLMMRTNTRMIFQEVRNPLLKCLTPALTQTTCPQPLFSEGSVCSLVRLFSVLSWRGNLLSPLWQKSVSVRTCPATTPHDKRRRGQQNKPRTPATLGSALRIRQASSSSLFLRIKRVQRRKSSDGWLVTSLPSSMLSRPPARTPVTRTSGLTTLVPRRLLPGPRRYLPTLPCRHTTCSLVLASPHNTNTE